MKRIKLITLILSSLIISQAQAQTTTATSPMNVTASVSASCSLSASPLNFGSINLSSSTASLASATANIVFNCTKDTAYSIKMDEGTHSDGTYRYMGNAGTDKLLYNIFDDTSTNIPLNTTFKTGTGSGNSTTFLVKGSLGTNQVAAAGSYSDVITVSITY